MSTEVTPESLRAHAAFMRSRGVVEFEVAIWDRWAERLERERRPLPTVPGWYPGIVVERGGESCTGALLRDDGLWQTPRLVSGFYSHRLDATPAAIIRWAEQDGTTPGQMLWEAQEHRVAAWRFASPEVQGEWESMAAAVLAAHGTPTLTDDDRSEEFHQGWLAGNDSVKPASLVLTPVGEHPEPGTRGLLPVVLNDYGVWETADVGKPASSAIFADPRPDGAHE